ncbi:MAG: cell division protein FtsZ [Cryomorphaceae bacterium]|nr:MAG: cell division protein FtsZ [Cryomorphaceae bacterium]
MKFDLPKDQSSIIKVVGVGGGGGNAVKHMYDQGIKGVDFLVCNTDAQALDSNPVPTKIQLGSSLTEGRGAGSIPEVGRNAAVENIDDVKAILEKNTHMVFITAGMGGGTGTGAAPVIAQAARDMGILTVGIVTMPFTFEGKKRKLQADAGIEAMRKAVDTLLIIKNDKLREIGGNLKLKDAFAKADDVLATAARGIAEVVSVTGDINVDMNDVNTVMRDSGVAIMGSAWAEGEDRAMVAVQNALESPLLNDNDIRGARYVLLNITYGNDDVSMDEITEITDYIQDAAGSTADVIWGHAMDESLGEKLSVTVIATGFKHKLTPDLEPEEPKKVVHELTDKTDHTPVGNAIHTPITKPTGVAEPPPAESTTTQAEQEEPFLKTQDSPTTQMPLSFGDEESSDEPYLRQSNREQESVNSQRQEESQPEETPQRKVYTLEDELPELSNEVVSDDSEKMPTQMEEPQQAPSMSREEIQKISMQRMQHIREVTSRLRTPSGLTDLEDEPAYKRRNIRLNEPPHSSESSVSRYSLSEDNEEEGRSELRQNNSFLHDNVD